MKHKNIIRHAGICFTLLLYVVFLIPCGVDAKIVFASKRNSDKLYHIYVMEDNGSNVQRITGTRSYDTNPQWFPDGNQILFARDLTKGKGFNSEFYIIDAKGKNDYHFMDNHESDFYPTVSPDGKQIAFTSLRSGEWNIHVVDLESGDIEQLTHNERNQAWSDRMSWSPDGKQIAYEHSDESGDYTWIMDADGGRKKRIGPVRGDANIVLGAPAWSPSGTYIMYAEQHPTPDLAEIVENRLVIYNVSTGQQDIHKFPKVNVISVGCWMGNDQTVLLAIKDDWTVATSTYDIYRYDLGSRALTNLTNHASNDYQPHWIDGSLAVFPLDKLTVRWGELKKRE